MRRLKNCESHEMDKYGCHLFLTAWEVIGHLRGCEVFQVRHPLSLYSVSSRIWEKYPVQYIWSDFRSRKRNPARSRWWKDQYVKVSWGRNLTIRLIRDPFWETQKGDPNLQGHPYYTLLCSSWTVQLVTIGGIIGTLKSVLALFQLLHGEILLLSYFFQMFFMNCVLGSKSTTPKQ